MIKVQVKKSTGYPNSIKYLWQNEIILITENFNKDTVLYTQNSSYEIEESSAEVLNTISNERSFQHNYSDPMYTEYKPNCYVNVRMIKKIILAMPVNSMKNPIYTVLLKNKKCIFISDNTFSKLSDKLYSLEVKNYLSTFVIGRLNNKIRLREINY